MTSFAELDDAAVRFIPNPELLLERLYVEHKFSTGSTVKVLMCIMQSPVKGFAILKLRLRIHRTETHGSYVSTSWPIEQSWQDFTDGEEMALVILREVTSTKAELAAFLGVSSAKA